MSRPPRFRCRCKPDVQTCCCSTKLPLTLHCKIVNQECDCLNTFFNISRPRSPQEISFCLVSQGNGIWMAELDLREVCCGKRWQIWFWCAEVSSSPCPDPTPGHGPDCGPRFDCNRFKTHICCWDDCEPDRCLSDFESRGGIDCPSAICCQCDCNPCLETGWIFACVTGAQCSCFSASGVHLIIRCGERGNIPFECPAGEVPNCCCICTPSPLTVCIDDSGFLASCDCIKDTGYVACTSAYHNIVCCPNNCELQDCANCWEGTLPLPDNCEAIFPFITFRICCSSSVFDNNFIWEGNCTGPLSCPIYGTAISLECETIDFPPTCLIFPGTCGCSGPQCIPISISE